MSITQQVIVLILGGGAAGSVLTLVKAWLSIKNNVDTREDVGIANLERWRRDADHRAQEYLWAWQVEQQVSSYWQNRAAEAEGHLLRNGINALPPADPPRRAILDLRRTYD